MKTIRRYDRENQQDRLHDIYRKYEARKYYIFHI